MADERLRRQRLRKCLGARSDFQACPSRKSNAKRSYNGERRRQLRYPLIVETMEQLVMMGHINNLLIRMVEKHHGAEGVSRLFELAGMGKKQYRPEVIYPEEEFQALYGAAKELYGVDDEAAQKAFSDYFMEVSPVMFPAIFSFAGSARGLFEKIPTIHRQWPSAASAKDFREKLSVLESTESLLTFKYDSPNHLCGVLRFVAEGVLTHYHEKGTVTETQCALNGAPWCEIEVRFGTT